MKNNLLLLLVALLPVVLFGQQISGRVIDAETSQPIPFAAVYITNVQVGTFTDTNGVFRFEIDLPDVNELKISAEFYKTELIRVSEDDLPVAVYLMPSHINMEDVVVSSPRGGLSRNNVFKIDRIDLKDLNTIQSSNLPEAISNMNGVQTSTTGAGIAKPVIRGMQGLRVLTLINGVRLNNQQWGGDHGLGISELGIGAVELIKGPSSLLYGSDAFGGVIYLADAPYPQLGKQQLKVGTHFESVNMGTSNTINYGLSKRNIRFNVAGLYSSYADYQLPGGNYLINSRYGQYAGKMSFSYIKKNWVSHLRYVYSNLNTGIPGETEEPVSSPLDFEHTEQIRKKDLPDQRNILHLASWENKFFFNKDELQVMLSYTNNKLSEFETDFITPGMELVLHSGIANLRYTHVINEKAKIVSGYQGVYQKNRNNPLEVDMLIPDFTQMDNGIYSIAYLKAGKFDLQFGGRIDQRSLNVPDDSLQRQYYAPNFSVGFVRNVQKNVVRLNVSSGYRAPHVSELLSDGAHDGALRYEIGDPNLKSEYTVQTDFDYEFQGDHFSLIINPFYNYLMNYIGLNLTDSIIDGLPVFEYQATPQASLYGADLGLHYHPHFAHFLHLETTYSYVRGHDAHGSNLSLIPQARLNTLLKFEFEGKFKKIIQSVALQHQYFFRQDRTTLLETASVDYHLINVGINGKVGVKHVFNWSMGVKNLLNQSYINHLSRLKNIGVYNPGRNLYVALTYEIPSF